MGAWQSAPRTACCVALATRSHPPNSRNLCYRRGHCHRRVTIAPETKIPNAATLVIEREDHTLGNILRMCAARPRLHLCLCRARKRTQLSSSLGAHASAYPRAGSCWRTRRSTLRGTVCHTRLSPPSRSRCRRAPTTRVPLTRSTALSTSSRTSLPRCRRASKSRSRRTRRGRVRSQRPVTAFSAPVPAATWTLSKSITRKEHKIHAASAHRRTHASVELVSVCFLYS